MRTQYLIKAGVELDARDKFQVTALHLAALGGYTEACATLLNAQVRVHNTTKHPALLWLVYLRGGGARRALAAAEVHRLDVLRLVCLPI